MIQITSMVLLFTGLGFAADDPMRPKATREKLIGTWLGHVRINADGLQPLVGQDLAGNQVKGIALAFQLLASTKQQTLTFHKDGSAVNALTRGRKIQEKRGSWKLLQARRDQLTIELTHAQDTQAVRMEFRLLDNDRMDLVLPGAIRKGITHRFTRQKPPG